ncbi:hypothetical protein BGP82_25915 [Pseudomonas putida]|uniref:Uncharacterized protein n=1 Tax=Pseudomonas putida TaxID=303 RepID=A0A2S3WKY6_PSEPU|nr:hypothetical protein BGP82_25915 [Pseudomonas putida]
MNTSRAVMGACHCGVRWGPLIASRRDCTPLLGQQVELREAMLLISGRERLQTAHFLGGVDRPAVALLRQHRKITAMDLSALATKP